jgi:hypothetical protein
MTSVRGRSRRAFEFPSLGQHYGLFASEGGVDGPPSALGRADAVDDLHAREELVGRQLWQ